MANSVSEQPLGGAGLNLIDGQFAIDFTAPLPEAGAGQPAFAVRSTRSGPGFMAVQVQLGWPARARMLTALAAAPVVNVLVPIAHGVAAMPSGESGFFVICHTPPGRPLSAEPRVWSEHELMDTLIRPAAIALADLHRRDTTHRAIRANNMFRAGPADPVMLGCAWAAPPASRQPCIYEPPYAAICLPAGRGDGSTADDVYALGILLVILALGRDPMAGLDDDAIIRAKVDQGSYAAVTGGHRLPSGITELARGMLADDPEHRPSAALLSDPAAARARRAAARPARRAQRPFVLGDVSAWTTRELALAVIARPDQAAPHIRNGAVALWLRRNIGDGAMASSLEDAARLRDDSSLIEEPRADALLATRAVAVLDPFAPMSWRRLTLWPDGLGEALNHALHTDPAQALALTEIASTEVPVAFGMMRPERSDIAVLRADARLVRTLLGARLPEHGALRLNYALNPMVPCASPLLAGQWVAKLNDLLPALETAANGPLRATLPPVDRHIVAFIGVRRDERGQTDLGQLATLAASNEPMALLRLLGRLQQYTHPGKLPALTAWMAEVVGGATAKFQSVSRRKALSERLAELAKAGLLPPLAALLDDQAKLNADAGGYQAAIARAAQIDATLEALDAAAAPREAAAFKTARDVTSGISLAACGLALAASVFL
jgi:hypothetical protein